MKLQDNPQRYGLVSIANHWLTAALMIGMVILGLYMADLPKGPAKGDLVNIHKSFGILVLMLGILRMVWRSANPLPRAVGVEPPWQRKTARLLHFVLMALILLLPLSGWLMSSAAARPVTFFGQFTLPALLSENKNLADSLRDVHEFLAWTLLALLSVHVGAALKHHFLGHDNTLRRMLGSGS